jgi:hypothetical protein
MKTQRTSTITIAALAGLFLSLAAPKVMAADECKTDQNQPLMQENGSSISGHGALVVNNEGADAIIRAENLIPGAAYTAWFIYFNNTSQCLSPGQCGPVDALMPATNPVGVFGRMDSAVAGTNGQLTFKGMLRDFHVSAGSAVYVELFAHGPASTTDNRARARQLLTPEAPVLGAPGLGVGIQKAFPAAIAIFDIQSCK